MRHPLSFGGGSFVSASLSGLVVFSLDFFFNVLKVQLNDLCNRVDVMTSGATNGPTGSTSQVGLGRSCSNTRNPGLLNV